MVRSGRTIVRFDFKEAASDPEGGKWDGNVGASLRCNMIEWMMKSQKTS